MTDNIFNDFYENQLPKFHSLPSQLGGLGSLSYEFWATRTFPAVYA